MDFSLPIDFCSFVSSGKIRHGLVLYSFRTVSGFDSHTAPYTVKMISDIPVPSRNVNYKILPGPNDSN